MKSEPTYRYIELDKLQLDNTNPRLPKSLHNDSIQSTIEFLLLEASTIEIMQSIGENGFFPGEQLLVVENENGFKVLEGNRRLVALLLLQDFTLASVKENIVRKVFEEAKYRPDKIPCLIFNNKNEIKKYIGFRHITGMKSWSLSSKARYLHDLKNSYFISKPFHEACRGLAKMIGSRKDYVERLLIAYEMYRVVEDEAFYKIKGLDDTSFYVGYLSDSLSRTHITNFLNIDLNSEKPSQNLNKANLKELIHWFYEKNDQNQTRLKGKSSDLNALNKVMAHEHAFKSFKEGTPLYEALELTEETDHLYRDSVKKSLKHLEMADRTVHKVSAFYVDAADDLFTIRKLSVKIKNTMEDLEDGF
jgi:hypothetical protein